MSTTYRVTCRDTEDSKYKTGQRFADWNHHEESWVWDGLHDGTGIDIDNREDAELILNDVLQRNSGDVFPVFDIHIAEDAFDDDDA